MEKIIVVLYMFCVIGIFISLSVLLKALIGYDFDILMFSLGIMLSIISTYLKDLYGIVFKIKEDN